MPRAFGILLFWRLPLPSAAFDAGQRHPRQRPANSAVSTSLATWVRDGEEICSCFIVESSRASIRCNPRPPPRRRHLCEQATWNCPKCLPVPDVETMHNTINTVHVLVPPTFLIPSSLAACSQDSLSPLFFGREVF
jgi:hypothetical protein